MHRLNLIFSHLHHQPCLLLVSSSSAGLWKLRSSSSSTAGGSVLTSSSCLAATKASPVPAPPPPPSPSLPAATIAAVWQHELLVKTSATTTTGLVEVQLNRPKALNALSMDMVICMAEYLKQLKTDSRCSTLLITGAGEKAFCAGGDVRSLASADGPTVQRYFSREYLVDFRSSTFTKPYVSVWKGIVMGGGCGISMHGSYRIASDKTMLAMPETSIGLMPDVGASYVLSRLPGGLGLYLGLTGARLNAADLMQHGLATHFIRAEVLQQFVDRLHTEDLRTDAHTAVGQILLELSTSPPSAIVPSVTEEHLAKIHQHFEKATSLIELLDALESDPHSFCQDAAKTIKSKCPLSCAVWFRQHTIGVKMSLADCLRMEFLLVQSFVLFTPNFREGVRALLVDKDNAPKWSPATIAEISEDFVDEMFVCPKGDALDNFVDLS
eukprot:GHVS01053730.1.p1 GENE.GHVS01053730.1~~GHVS01053730.1.p1  ORF type:complete len:439 (+),score=92.90 GHVS01053730.1:216-1532(+)